MGDYGVHFGLPVANVNGSATQIGVGKDLVVQPSADFGGSATSRVYSDR